MVRLILDGKKNQTRRPIKDRDITNSFDVDVDGTVAAYIDQETGDSFAAIELAKYSIGDVLYVRETWSTDKNGEYMYRTNYGVTMDDSFPPSMFKWKPSIHMPKEAARIFLKVTDVRVERLEDISDIGCEAEGIRPSVDGNGQDWRENENGWHRTFRQEWDSIYKEKGYGWDTNPWVFVYKIVRGEGE